MKIKKIVLLVIISLIVTGCMDTGNLPSRKVEDFMSKYQKLDAEVLTQLDLTLDNNSDLTTDQKKEYKALMQKQYQNLSYKIKDEKINKNKATVDIEVEVYDYKTSNIKAREYYDTHKSEFKEDKDFEDYKIKKMKDVTARIVYSIRFNLLKNDNNEWELVNITDNDRKKLHGLY